MFNPVRPLSAYWRDVAWQASGNTLAQAIGVLGIPLLTRLYIPEDFAIQSLFIQAVIFASGVMTWRYEFFIQLPKTDADARGLHQLVLILGGASAVAMTPLVWVYRFDVAHLMGNEGLAPWLVGAPMTAFLMSFALSVQHLTQRSRDFKTSGMSELASKGVYIGTGILGVLAGQGPAGLVATTAFSALGKIAWLSWKRGANLVTPWLAMAKILRQAKTYRRLASSLVVSHMLTTCASAIPLIAMVRLYGAEVLGQFALVMSTVFLPSGILGAAIGQVYYQRAAEMWSHSSDFSRLFNQTAGKLIVIGVPVYGLAAVLSPFIYPLVFGAIWRQAGEFAVWMSIAAFCSFVSSPLDRTCLIVGAWWYPMFWHAFRALSAVAVVWAAWTWDWPVTWFVPALVIQMCLAYVLDFMMEFLFSKRQP